MPLISVVMPAYNAENTIAESIVSVLNQTVSDLELIICNDGSKDNTAAIIKKYMYSDNRIVFINNIEALGAAEARNLCLEKSSSRYLCFLDSDDLWHQDKLRVQLSFMTNNDLEMSHGQYEMFDSDGVVKRILTPRKIHYADILKRCDIGCLTVMIDSYKIGNIKFPNVPKEDYALWITIMKHGMVSVMYPGCLAYYRKQKHSISSSKVKEIKKQWNVLKYVAKISFLNRLICVSQYCAYGFIKHYTKY
ncbi:glycosyltransferase family 2 protein [Pectobacterium parvum]|uniref:Glycosyltransferase n=1 Tax=Pectobacterium parvum TaxID=2778550 RepID=A0AAP9IK10_9GAMM|nr:glycosyltransferase family 2 protein [Pectobacterium parvum]QHQ25099.1 glycosyltransferase [Pectobacterium parvum]